MEIETINGNIIKVEVVPNINYEGFVISVNGKQVAIIEEDRAEETIDLYAWESAEEEDFTHKINLDSYKNKEDVG